ncbi:MAG TPA: DUF3300 domain-containing protein [Bryocella sp.]|nr:DUF3300 domain-containing protein [Bryocella sp.]
MPYTKQILAIVLTCGVALSTMPPGFAQEAPEAAYSQAQVEELVSPIALYPDALVAQILAAATYPDQVVQANTWLQGHTQLNEAQRMEQVDKQSWDPSVKALTQFPSVLANMASNLSWTSALGDASFHQQKDVLAAVQKLRKQAKDAGNLKSTSQQKVTTETQQGQQIIVIQPANPQVVYVPTYNPTVVYGTPYYPPGYSTAALVTTGIISFGVGMAVGAAVSGGCCGWGWNSWGCGWHGGTVVYNRNVYVSNSHVYRNGGYYGNGPRPTPYNRGNYNRNTNVSGNTVNINGGNRNNINTGNINSGNRNTNNIGNGNRNTNAGNGGNRNPNIGSGNGNRGNGTANPGANRPNAGANTNRPNTPPSGDRGYGQRPSSNNGAFNGYNSGGATRAESNRGRQSLGGGSSTGGARSSGATRSGGGARGGGRR